MPCPVCKFVTIICLSEDCGVKSHMKQVVTNTWSKLVWINSDCTNLHNAVDVLDVRLVVRGCIEQDVIIRSEQKRDSIFSGFATEDILVVWCMPQICNVFEYFEYPTFCKRILSEDFEYFTFCNRTCPGAFFLPKSTISCFWSWAPEEKDNDKKHYGDFFNCFPPSQISQVRDFKFR